MLGQDGTEVFGTIRQAKNFSVPIISYRAKGRYAI
jgi:hypothetical protein